jgi:hypothetical protein
MMKTTFLAPLLLLASLSSTSNAGEELSKKSEFSSPTYEYKILGVSKYAAREDLEEELNRLGKLGWKIEAVERVVFGGMRDTLEIFLSRERGNHEK